MSGGISLQNPSRYPIDSESLKRASQAVLACHPHDKDGSLSIVLTDSKTISGMNLRYAKVDAPTDVLSFPAEPAPRESGECGRYLGDIVIAFDYAAGQAQKTAAAVDDSLCLLVIHGTLHLLGYHHDTQAARDRMWALQVLALRAINVDPAVVELYGNIEND